MTTAHARPCCRLPVSLVIAATGLLSVSLARPVEFGTVRVAQNDAGNNTTSVSLSLDPVRSAGPIVIGPTSNKGDYVLDFPAGNDLESGVLIPTVAENGRDNSAGGDPAGTFFATAAAAADASALTSEYFLAVSKATSGDEFNADISFGWFDNDDYLAAVAVNSTNNAALTTLRGSPGILLGSEFVDNGNGTYTVDLRSLGGHSADGILLVTSARNEDNYALSRANADGTFTIFSHDSGFNGATYERDGVAFVFIPDSAAGKLPVLSSGRVTSTSFTAAGAQPTIGFPASGRWHLDIPNYGADRAVLLVTPEGGGINNVDNIVSAEWDDAAGHWVIESRDLTGTGLQAGQPGEVMFNYVVLSEEVVVTTSSDEDDGSLDPDLGSGTSLREAVTHSIPGTAVTFQDNIFNSSLTLSLEDANGDKRELLLGHDITIDASALPNGFGISGIFGTRCFRVAPDVEATLRSLTISNGNNRFRTDPALPGAGIFNDGGTLVLEDCVIEDCVAQRDGGGIFSTGGSLTVRRSIIRNNEANDEDNRIDPGRGGGIYATGSTVLIEDSAILDNRALTFLGIGESGAGGGLYLTGGGAPRIVRSTIAGNESGLDGGGLTLAGNVQAVIINSTIADNIARDDGGGIDAGGAFSVSLLHVTITGNSAEDDGGGIFGDTVYFVENSIVAGNTSRVFGADFTVLAGSINRGGNNLIGDNDSVEGAFPAGLPNTNGDYVGSIVAELDPLLAPLRNYGGPTPTRPPAKSSVAFNPPASSPSSLATDQRGVSRVGSAEIGAVEVVDQTVFSAADSGPGSLREAVAQATPDTFILFDQHLVGPIELTSGELDVLVPVNIAGPFESDPPLVIDAGGQSRIFDIAAGLAGEVVIDSLELADGQAASGDGGAIRNAGSPLALRNVTIRDSSAPAGQGGGLASSGSLEVSGCVFAANSASGNGGGLVHAGPLDLADGHFQGNTSGADGGGVHHTGGSGEIIYITMDANTATGDGGAIFSTGALTMTNVTIAGNDADEGGGIFHNSAGNEECALAHVTVAGNSARSGGGIAARGGTVRPRHSIVAGNTADDGSDDFSVSGSGQVQASEPNLVGNAAGVTAVFPPDGVLVGGGTFPVLDPRLAPLGNYGGFAPTRPPLADSPAIDAATESTGPSFDQRNNSRPLDGDGDGTAVADLGAAELVAELVTSAANSGAGSLRAALVDPGAEVIFFDPAVFDGEAGDIIELTSPLVIDRTVGLIASGLPRGLTISGRGETRVLDISGPAEVVLDALTIRDGNAGSGDGGGLSNVGANLVVRNSTFVDNRADFGGGVYSETDLSGTATVLEQCTFTRNRGRGGAVFNTVGATELIRCTVADNAAPPGFGGGVAGFGNEFTLTTLTECIVRDNPGDDLVFVFGSENSFRSGSGNIVGVGSGVAPPFGNPGDIQFGDTVPIRLAPLGYYGGPTPTMHPLAGSPAIDSVFSSNAGPTDQRGLPRFVDGDADGTPRRDVGAVEGGPVVVVDTPADDAGTATSLRRAIQDATIPGTVIRFDPAVFDGESGDTILFGSEIAVGPRTIFVDGSDLAAPVTLDGGDSTRLLNLAPASTLAAQNLVLTRGRAPNGGPGAPGNGGQPGDDGGGILSAGILTLNACVVSSCEAGTGGPANDFFGGAGGGGGGIANLGGILALTGTTVADNRAGQGGPGSGDGSGSGVTAGRGGWGGGILTEGGLTMLESSALLRNAAGDGGSEAGTQDANGGNGGPGGAIFHSSGGLLTLRNSTVIDNVAGSGTPALGSSGTGGNGGGGGGIFSEGALAVTASTLSRNATGSNASGPFGSGNNGSGGGIFAFSDFLLENTVVAGNSAVPGSRPDIYNPGLPVVLRGANLIGDLEGLGSVDPNDPAPLTGDPRLEGALTSVAGFPPALVPLFGSPLIDAAGASAVTDRDQLGTPRDATPDIGAAEFTGLRVTTAIDENDGVGAGEISLREALAVNPPGEAIRFRPELAGATITLVNGQLVPSGDVIIDVSEMDGGLAISGGGTTRVFDIPAGLEVTMDSLTIRDGNTPAAGGGIRSAGVLRMNRCEVLDNRSEGGGGGIEAREELRMTECLVRGNSTTQFGGGIKAVVSGTFVLLDRCTLTGNTGALGAALKNEAATTSMVNCSVVDNSGDGARNDNGGSLLIRLSTITGNSSLGISQFGILLLEDTIVAENGFDIDGNPFTERGTNFITGNPLLAPLGDYGGPTPTRPPLPGSPVIEQVEVLTASYPDFDQRGAPRRIGNRIDIGSVEAVPLAALGLPSNDGDAIPDILEGPGAAYPFLDPHEDDSAVDTDGDGVPDEQEIGDMTNLLDGRDFFRITDFSPAPGFDPAVTPVVAMTFTTFPGLDYEVEIGDTLGNLQVLPGSTFTADGLSATFEFGFEVGIRNFARAVRK